jgi:putative transposase
MSVSRRPRLSPGDRVRFREAVHTVTTLAGGRVGLADAAGVSLSVSAPDLFSDKGFAVVGPGRLPVPLPPRGLVDSLPADVLETVRWWERHLVELLTGVPPDASPGASPRPEYDPRRRTLRRREVDKVAELAAEGRDVSLSGLQRIRRRYQTSGLLGLVDGRITRAGGSGVDERVMAAIGNAIAAETDRSTGTIGRLRRGVEQILRADGIDPGTVMPPRTTFYRLAQRVSAGQHTFGSAPTRRSLAQQPAGPFGVVRAVRPGEWMQVDSTPLDVRVVLDDGTVDRVELTWMIDVATRTIAAGVLRPTTKAVDASLLLARSLTPEPMRPGWVEALRMSRSVLPYQRLVGLDQRLEHAAARPVIVPETIVCDHGTVYLSQTFRTACRAMGINFQATHPGSPWEKGIVERSFDSVASLFAQYVAGYVGRSVDRRGKDADQDAVWSMAELQELLDEWIVAHWQNRPHDGLRHPLTPGRALTPNEQYAALIEIAGYVPVPLGSDDYIELLPATWRVVNSYGIKISHRTYDTSALNPYRRQHSGITASNGRWEVHYDPYDVTRVWIRNHIDGGWITAPWTHLLTTPIPFGDQAWGQAQQILARRGENPATETQIAAAVAALLDRAEQGPDQPRTTPSKRDRRVAARTRATSEPAWPRPVQTPPAATDPTPADPTAMDTDGPDEHVVPLRLAPVIPLGIFDAREEAKKWW